MKNAAADPLDTLLEDRLLWQFWVNKGMRREALMESLAALPAEPNWDYLAGNSLYGGFESALFRELSQAARRAAPGPKAGTLPTPPERFLLRFEAEVTGRGARLDPGSSEGRLLVLCSSPRMTQEEDDEASRAAVQGLAWDTLVAAAARANMTLAVQHNLARLELDARMPADLASALAARARGAAARNLRMLALLEEVIDLLRAAGLRCLLLKESALALTHFGNGRLRMMGDIDFLVSRNDLAGVESALSARGWEPCELLWTREHYLARHQHAAPLVSSRRAAKIEPHQSIALPVREPAGLIAGMSARAVRVDARCWCFTPTDTLFHLCMDLFGGAFIGKMGQIADAREVIRQGGVEWEALEELARASEAEAHLAFSLSLLRRLDAAVPPATIDRLASGRPAPFPPGRLRRMALRNAFGVSSSGGMLSRDGEKLRYRALMRPGGPLSRAWFLLRSYLYLDAPDEGAGELARDSRPSTGRALGRLLRLPLRVLRRWTASRRVS